MDKQTIILSVVSAIVGGLCVLVFSGLVGNQSDGPAIGASGTRFPNGISVDSTSPSAGQIRSTTLTTTGNMTVDTDTLVVNSTSNRVGVASATPSGQLSVGTSAATSTIQAGKLCIAAQTVSGSNVYLRLTGATGSALNWATSTTDCR